MSNEEERKEVVRYPHFSGYRSREEVEHYPLRSLHDFLAELDIEWGRFLMASIIGIIICVALMFLLLYFSPVIRRYFGIRGELISLITIAAFLTYENYLLIRQYRFFTKWERRVGLLLHLEERLMQEAESKAEKQA